MTEKPRASVLVASIKPKSLGNPKVAAGFTDADMAAGKTHWLGILMGKATGIKAFKDQRDETQIGGYALTGFFEGQPDDASLPILKSGKMFLPGGIQEMIVEAVQSGGSGAVVSFKFRTGTRRDSCKAGYVYYTEEISGIVQQDPLADMRGDIKTLAFQDDPATDDDVPNHRPAKSGGKRK